MALERVKVRRGFFPLVKADTVSIEQAGAAAILSRGDTDLTQAGAQLVIGGGNTSIHQGGANLLASGGDVSVSQGGAVVAAARSVRAERSYIGLAIARRIELSDCTIVAGPREAALFGAIAGVTAAFLARLSSRRPTSTN